MKVSRSLVLLGLLTLAACGSTPGNTSPQPSPIVAPARQLQSFGLYELSVNGATTAAPESRIFRTGLSSQTNDIQGLKFTPLSTGTYTDELSRTRYLRASFKVSNETGQPLTVPTYVPVDTDGNDATVGATPFKAVQYFDGSDASSRALELQLDTAHRFNSATGANEIDLDATPLVTKLDTRGLVINPPPGTTIAQVFHQGWQGRQLAPGGTQVVTFAARLPMAADSKLDPFRFKLMFAVTDNPAPLPDDQIAPTVSLTLDPIELTSAGSVTFRAAAEDNVGIRDVTFYDGDKLLGTVTEAPYEWKSAYTAADNGEHVIRAVATDTSGNTAQTTSRLNIKISTANVPFIGSGPADLMVDLIRSNRGEGVSDSTVRLYHSGDRTKVLAETQTDKSGFTQFLNIPEGTYDLVFSKANAAGSEFNGAVAKAGVNQRLKIAQFDAQNPTAGKATAKLAVLTPTALAADGTAVDWKVLTPGTVMNNDIQLRAYTTAENPAPLQLKYLMFSVVNFDATGQMTELRSALASIDAGKVNPGMESQDSGLMTLDTAGLQGDIYVQVSSLDFNNNRSAYLIPVRLERSSAPGAVTAPTGVSALAYTNGERINYIYGVTDPSTQGEGKNILPDTNSWVSVSWDMPSTTAGLTGFRVLRAVAPQGPYSEVAFAGVAQCRTSTKRCTASDNTATLQVGQDYYYRVKAIGSNEALSAAPSQASTRILPPFKPQLLSPGSEQTDVSLLPEYTFKTNAFEGGATGLRFDLRVSDAFTSVGNTDAPPLRIVGQGGTFKVIGADNDTRDYAKWVTYDVASDVVKVPHDLTRVRSGLAPQPLQTNRRYSWMLHRAYTYRLLDPTLPESTTNPVVAYSVYSDPDTTKIVPGGVTQSVSTVYHFITRP